LKTSPHYSQVEAKLYLLRNCITFKNAVWSLLKILSTATVTPLEKDHLGLELEISLHSPSDCKHVFRPFALQDDYPLVDKDAFSIDADITQYLRRRQEEEANYHDPPHGWTHGTHEVPNPSGSPSQNPSGRDRLYGTRLLDFNFSRAPKDWPDNVGKDRCLPRAGIVREFTIRRASFRGFSAKVLFKFLHEAFPNIKSVRFER
jgi:hypothetical protein